MWRKAAKTRQEPLVLTPGEYVVQLKECKGEMEAEKTVDEAVRQIIKFQKRVNDLHLIAYREFWYDDALSRANLLADMMEKRFYSTVRRMLLCLKGAGEEQEAKEKMVVLQKCICDNAIVIQDVCSLLAKMLTLQEEDRKNSLLGIEDVIVALEEIYINELTQA